MQTRPAGDWIVIVLSLSIVVGLVVAYFYSLARNRYHSDAMCLRSDVTYGLLGALGFVGMVLAFTNAGPDWLHRSLAVVGAPILISLLVFGLFAGRKAQETILQLLLLGSGAALIGVAWILTSGQPSRLMIVGYTTGTALGWMILERKKGLLPPTSGMIWVRIEEEE